MCSTVQCVWTWISFPKERTYIEVIGRMCYWGEYLRRIETAEYKKPHNSYFVLFSECNYGSQIKDFDVDRTCSAHWWDVNSCRIPEWRKRLGKQRHTLEDNIKMIVIDKEYDYVDRFRLAGDKIQWWAFVNTLMSLRKFMSKIGICMNSFLARSGAVSYWPLL